MSRKKTKKNGIKRFLIFLTVLSMLFGMSQTVSAGLYEPDRKGSFTLTLREDEKGTGTEPKVFPGIGMRIYKVGSVKNNSGVISFVIDAALQSTGVNFDNMTTADASAKMANILANAIGNSEIAFQDAISDANGIMTFGNLDPGMYLIVKRVEHSEIKILPTLLPLPYMEDVDTWLYDVAAYPKIETQGNKDDPSPEGNLKMQKSVTSYYTTPARSTVHTTTTSSTASAVKTGDDTPIAIWIGVLAVAAVAIGAMILRKKKKG